MDDIMSKLGSLMSDPESMKQLSELAQIFMSETNSSEAADTSDSNCNSSDNATSQDSSDLFSNFDFSKLFKIQEIIGAVSGKDKNAELLLALKPHLKDEKQKKVDKAIKLMKIIAIWGVVKDSGILKDFME